MNPKIEKLKAERSRNTEKISDLQNRNRKLSEQITKLENNDIIGMVREYGLSPDMLFELIKRNKKIPASFQMPEIHNNETEEKNSNE